ncbi:hypothetical protein [Aureivirga sp. CE67]|uniref:hypothetical protein n=1 Tax=Aureivirga sp. CE67 TaxID=1788983 RepID=UPI0018C9D6F1|nr:hypothetical protein [Aureivirga sp. CE67]
MKNFRVLVAVLAIGTLGFTSCSKDDDGDSNSAQNCYECKIEILGNSQVQNICENEDGTLTVTTQGISNTVEDTTLDEYVSLQELVGAECTKK